MKRSVITGTMVELRSAIQEAEGISAKADLSKRDEQRINVLLAKIAALRANAVAPDDFAKRWFSAFLRGHELPFEGRGTDLLAGTNTPTYTQAAKGGVLVPQEIHNELVLGLSTNDPFLNPNVVTLVTSDTFQLRPYTVPGWDLTAIEAAIVDEAVQQNPGTVPPATASHLNGYTFRQTLDAAFEFEQDDFQNVMDQMQLAYQQAFARGVGKKLTTGNGSTEPQGILTGAHDSGVTTAAAGSLTYTDFSGIYFSVEEVYRNSPKCAWAMNDTLYKQVRDAHDTNGRPLINVIGDKELLLGKPVLISPTLTSTAGTRGIVFGDFAHFVVRLSRMTLTRNLQAPGYVDKGKGLYTGRLRADSKVIDPTGGSKSPIVYATLHA